MGNPAEGYAQENKNYNPEVDKHSRIATPDNLLDPAFVAFDINRVGLTDYAYNPAWDLHLTPGSPALTGAEGTLTPYFSEGMTIGTRRYVSPDVQPYYGALGTK